MGVKSKQKASGQFWNIESAKWYAKIKTYTETCYRNGINVYNTTLMLILGEPYTLKEILSGKINNSIIFERIFYCIPENLVWLSYVGCEL